MSTRRSANVPTRKTYAPPEVIRRKLKPRSVKPLAAPDAALNADALAEAHRRAAFEAYFASLPPLDPENPLEV